MTRSEAIREVHRRRRLSGRKPGSLDFPRRAVCVDRGRGFLPLELASYDDE